MKKPLSIQKTIFGLAVLLLLLASIVLSLISYQQAHRAAERTFDRLLVGSTLTIANAIQIEAGELQVELPFAAMAMLAQQERIFYTIRSSEQLISGYDDLALSEPLAQSSTPSFTTLTYKGSRVRVATVGRFVSGPKIGSGWITIRVAETLGTRNSLTHQLFTQSLLPLALLIGLALLLVWYSIRHAFSPLSQLESAIARRSPTNLEPIQTQVPQEIQGLMITLNEFIKRLRHALSTTQHLVAEAAHQIRTPLALLQAQAEDALDETDPQQQRQDLEQIHRHTMELSQLVHQLLMHATITHRQGSTEAQLISIGSLIDSSTQRLHAQSKNRLRIHITPTAQSKQVQGDQIALREMLRNVIENALLYSDDFVELWAYINYEKNIVIDIQDRGPGIEDKEKKKVLQRFYRGASAQKKVGSGLGLAIARHVAQHHQGQLLLLNRRSGSGLTVRIMLPTQTHNSATSTQPALFSQPLYLICMLGLLSILMTPLSEAKESSFYPALETNNATEIHIAGPTDTEIFAPLLLDFQSQNPQVAIHYYDIDTQDLYKLITHEQLNPIDVVISSATDLQVRLVNDGYSKEHQSALTENLPEWAQWRHSIFGFTLEPIVLVYNNQLDPLYRSTTRAQFLSQLELNPSTWYGKIGTYNIERSGLGYLLAVFDERLSSNFWGMTNALGRVGTHLYATTAAILDDLDSGQLWAGYNLLGSYALARQQSGANIEVIIPEDYVLVFSRTAFIHHRSPQPHLAGQFIDYLLSDHGQRLIATQMQLGALIKETDKKWPEQRLYESLIAPIQPISIGPSLLTGLDTTRKKRFIQNWMRLITDTPSDR